MLNIIILACMVVIDPDKRCLFAKSLTALQKHHTDAKITSECQISNSCSN